MYEIFRNLLTNSRPQRHFVSVSISLVPSFINSKYKSLYKHFRFSIIWVRPRAWTKKFIRKVTWSWGMRKFLWCLNIHGLLIVLTTPWPAALAANTWCIALEISTVKQPRWAQYTRLDDRPVIQWLACRWFIRVFNAANHLSGNLVKI